MPTIDITLTEKIHGSQNGVCYNHVDGMWTQSKKQITTPEKDNAGSSSFCTGREDVLVQIIENIAEEHSINLSKHGIALFGEFCGGNIQKLSAVTSLDKRLILFRYCKVFPIEPTTNDLGEEVANFWVVTSHKGINCSNNENGIYNIMDFPTYNVSIDFNTPTLSYNSIIEMVENDIEPNSPVGNQFGVDGNVGEGVVLEFMRDNVLYRAKIKGEKHSNSKVKVLKPVDDEKEQAKIDFVNYAVPPRLEQALVESMDIVNGGTPDIKKTGDFIRWLINDIIKEESDVLVEKGIVPKDINSLVSKMGRNWLINKINQV